MKKIFSILLVLSILLSVFGTISVSAATLPFALDFNAFAENATITATNSGMKLVPGQTTVNGANVQKTKFIAVTDNGSPAMQIALNSASGVSSASARFEIQNIDTSNLRDLTLSFDYKSIGGAKLNLYISTTSDLQSILEADDAAWASYTFAFDFEKVEAELFKNGASVSTFALTDMKRASDFTIRFSTSVNATKSHMFDNISVTTSGDTYSQERADAYNAGKVTKAPYVAGPDGKPVVIIKADDLTPKTVNSFNQLYTLFSELGVVGGFGAITHRCEEFTAEQWATVKGWVDDGFEIWHHGYDHDGVYVDEVFQNDADFIGRSSEKMEFYLNYGIDLFAEHGIKIQSVGAPYNRTDATFIDTINTRFPSRITSVMNNSASNADCYCLQNRLDAEVDNKTALEAIQAAYAAKPDRPYYVMQMHASVQVKDLDSLEAAILYLRDEVGCVFMTPSQYLAYIEAEANKDKPEITGITFEDATVVYDGTAKKIEITGTLPEGATLAYTNAENTEIGTHHARALIKKAGYKDLVLTADLTIEAPVVAEPIADLQISADGTTVTYSANSNANGSYFVLSLYDAEDKPCGTKIAAVNGPVSGTVTASKAPASYKVFILKSFITMQIGSDVITGTL